MVFYRKNIRWAPMTKASITIEAAYVMPLVIYVIIAIIYLAFYLHDYCILQNAIDMTVLKASFYANQPSDMGEDEIYYEAINSRGVFYQLIGDTSPIKQQVLYALKRELENSMFLYDRITLQTEVDHNNIKLIVSAKRNFKLPMFGMIFRSMEHTNLSTNYSIHQPAEAIRSMEVIMNTASEIKGVREFKEKLEKQLKRD
jgi:hypothetical protein